MIVNSRFQECTASSGGGVCTAVADDPKLEGKSTEFDLTTQLMVDATFEKNLGGDIVAGPYFELRFPAHSAIKWWNESVQYRRRLCRTGEYLSNSGFCEQCPANTYSMYKWDPPALGHNNTECLKAPPSGYAPGGAVLIALSEHWHNHGDSSPGSTGPYPGCTDCHRDDPWRPDVKEIRRWVCYEATPAELACTMQLIGFQLAVQCSVQQCRTHRVSSRSLQASLHAWRT
jgi:hypothetical protein